MKRIEQNDKAEFLGQIIDIFEDFLEERGVMLSNPEREEDEDAAIIYGTDYGELQSQLEELLTAWDMI